jgi:3-oxosteroid 1-dehydrogenase
MDDAWWGPTFRNPQTGETHFSVVERSLPHSIIVESQGKRFMNEAQSYIDCGHAMYKRNKDVPAIPAWLVFDTQYRNRYLLVSYLPGRTPDSAFTSGFIAKADNISALAKKIGVNSEGLISTIDHFNSMARRGIDDEFERGRTAYDRQFGDPSCKPNPNLGTLQKPPFFAMQMWPGDLGTKGGLVTDESGHVITKDGKQILGLYAAGNTSATVMGRTYPGAGSTLEPAMTFAFISVDDMALKGKDELSLRPVRHC